MFKPGDIVRLKTGSCEIVVTEVLTYELRGYYKKSGYEVDFRDREDFILIKEFNGPTLYVWEHPNGNKHVYAGPIDKLNSNAVRVWKIGEELSKKVVWA